MSWTRSRCAGAARGALATAAHDRRGYGVPRLPHDGRRPGLVKKQQLRPSGRGSRDQHLFELSELDRYTRDRGLAYGARRVEYLRSSGILLGAVKRLARRKGDELRAPGEGDEAEERADN